ncbi:MAG TPA: molybdate ABC transporter substrate-binding protein [Solirubrobacteraceae bacterium]|nr:molybdate ABC transporter substrate-binding protein [Solirubrobacteraceae bacterium]
MRRASRLATCTALLCALAAAGCGSSAPTLRVSAAASLQQAFTSYAKSFAPARVSLSFAGSDALAAQIEHGARPDVFASANLELPAALYAKGLVEKPVEFAANKLVLAVPARSSITTITQAMRPGVTIAVGTPTVPIGFYTATVLAHLAPAPRRALLVNIRDRESDVTGIVGKLDEGAVDAGFVYTTDAAATRGAVRAIALPAALQPRVGYAAAVVRGSGHGAQARAFIRGLLAGAGRAKLRASGFLPPASA